MTKIISVVLNDGKNIVLIEKKDNETESEATTRYIEEHPEVR